MMLQTVVVSAVTPAHLAAGAVILGLFIGGKIAADAYADSPSCAPSPMCTSTYCYDNPSICDLFKGKTIDCCSYTFVL